MPADGPIVFDDVLLCLSRSLSWMSVHETEAAGETRLSWLP